MDWRSQEGEQWELVGEAASNAGGPLHPTAPERNAVQGLPGSGKIWVLGGAKNTVWQPLPPRSGILLLPSRPPTRGKTGSLSAPRPRRLGAQKHPSPCADVGRAAPKSPPHARQLPSSQVPSLCLPWPRPRPWVSRAPRRGANSRPDSGLPTPPHCSERCGPMPSASLRPPHPLWLSFSICMAGPR